MRVLIAGFGDVGQRLAKLLLGDGHQVYGLKRSGHAEPLAGLQTIRADLSAVATIPDDLPGFDYLVYLPTPDRRDRAAYEAIFVTGLNNLLQRVRLNPGGRLLFVSSTAVYAQTMGEWVDETSPTVPQRFNGQVLLAAEQNAHASCQAVTTVRFSGIYGPGRERMLRQAEALTEKDLTNVYTNRIHVVDCARALQHLMGVQQPAALYLASDDWPARRRDVLLWLAARLGGKGGETGWQHSVSAAQPARLNLANQGMRQGKRISNRRLRHAGFEFLYPHYQVGYDELIKMES